MEKETLLLGILECMEDTGTYQLEHFMTLPHGAGQERHAGENVSHIDSESENRLQDSLVSLVPGSSFYCRETERQRRTKYTWAADPIDGTTNYISKKKRTAHTGSPHEG